LNFFEWSVDKGAKDAADIGYVPLPQGLVSRVKVYWAKTLKTRT
jgi:phosphate transport system substrate-binding protein